jgi:hypothetical protein
MAVVRTLTKIELRKTGMTGAEAREAVEDVDEDLVEHAATSLGMTTVGAIGDGSILKWIAEHKELIMQIVMFIVSMLAKPAAVVPPAAS